MGGLTYRTEAALLLASLATALALRLHGLYLAGVRLTTVRRDYPYGEIIGAYPVPHNHILDSLLVRLSTQILVAK